MSTGEFFCSHCGADRSYVLQQFRRWFTFFFIPLFPVGKPLGEQVQCTDVRDRASRPRSSNMPTSAAFSENLGGATRVAAMSMLAAGDPTNAAARIVAIDAARRTGTTNYDETWLANDLDALDPSQLHEYLEPLAKGLDPHGKETFVEQIARIGLADGPLTPPETQVLESLSSALGLSAAHLRGIIVTTSSPDEYRHN